MAPLNTLKTLEPESRCCHKAIMSLLLFLMNLLQDDDVMGKKKKKAVFGILNGNKSTEEQ